MTDSNIIVHQMPMGPMDNFVYLIEDPIAQSCMVVDPAWDPMSICEKIAGSNLSLAGILLTHGHADHTNGLEALHRSFPGSPVYISQFEPPIFRPFNVPLTDLADNQTIKFGSRHIRAIHTPGHSPGSQCFLIGDILLSGDTLFIDGCGNCKMPGNDPEKLYFSLHETLWTLSDQTRIFPGHNYGSTPTDLLGRQKISNPYLTCREKSAFIQLRMGL